MKQEKPNTDQAYASLNKYFEVEDQQYLELKAEIDNVQLNNDAKKTDANFSDDEDTE